MKGSIFGYQPDRRDLGRDLSVIACSSATRLRSTKTTSPSADASRGGQYTPVAHMPLVWSERHRRVDRRQQDRPANAREPRTNGSSTTWTMRISPTTSSRMVEIEGELKETSEKGEIGNRNCRGQLHVDRAQVRGPAPEKARIPRHGSSTYTPATSRAIRSSVQTHEHQRRRRALRAPAMDVSWTCGDGRVEWIVDGWTQARRVVAVGAHPVAVDHRPRVEAAARVRDEAPTGLMSSLLTGGASRSVLRGGRTSTSTRGVRSRAR